MELHPDILNATSLHVFKSKMYDHLLKSNHWLDSYVVFLYSVLLFYYFLF